MFNVHGYAPELGLGLQNMKNLLELLDEVMQSITRGERMATVSDFNRHPGVSNEEQTVLDFAERMERTAVNSKYFLSEEAGTQGGLQKWIQEHTGELKLVYTTYSYETVTLKQLWVGWLPGSTCNVKQVFRMGREMM